MTPIFTGREQQYVSPSQNIEAIGLGMDRFQDERRERTCTCCAESLRTDMRLSVGLVSNRERYHARQTIQFELGDIYDIATPLASSLASRLLRLDFKD